MASQKESDLNTASSYEFRNEQLELLIRKELGPDMAGVFRKQLRDTRRIAFMEAAQIAETPEGTVFDRPAPLKARLVSIFAPTRSLRKMARTTRLYVSRQIRAAVEDPP